MRYVPPVTITRLLSELRDEDDPTSQRLESVAEVLSDVPISVFSTSDGPNTSKISATRGQIGVERGSGSVRLWYGQEDGIGGWLPLTAGSDPDATATPPSGAQASVGAHTHSKADLPATIAYEDEHNLFQIGQRMLSQLTVEGRAVFGNDLDVTSFSTLSGGFVALENSRISASLHIESKLTVDSRSSFGGVAFFANNVLVRNGSLAIRNASPTEALDISSATMRLRNPHTPASGTASGNTGDISWDSSYVYVCTSTNSWSRATLNTF